MLLGPNAEATPLLPFCRGRGAAIAFVLFAAASAPCATHAELPVGTALTYVPAGFVSSLKTDAQVDGYLADLDEYGIGQVLFNLPRLRRNGALPLGPTEATMLARWVERAAAYRAAHGRSFAIVPVLNARLDQGIDLGKARTRRKIVLAVRALTRVRGIAGIHLDFEPYPTTVDFIRLLDELGAALAPLAPLAPRGPSAGLSVAAPADFTRWPAAHWANVGARVAQLDPLYYDSGYASAAEYQSWVESSLAQIGSVVPRSTRIVPVVAAYGATPWHDPSVENLTTAVAALRASLAAGSRVHGAGVWWWWGLFYDEGGGYDASADRAAWQDEIRRLDYTPLASAAAVP